MKAETELTLKSRPLHNAGKIIFGFIIDIIIAMTLFECLAETEMPYYREVKKTIEALRKNTNVRVEKEENRPVSYNFTYNDSWTLRYTDGSIVLRIREPIVREYLSGFSLFWENSTFLTYFYAYAEIFEYDFKNKTVSMYGSWNAQEDSAMGVEYDVTNDKYSFVAGKGGENEFSMDDDETDEWIRTTLESTDWKSVFEKDLQKCMEDLSALGLTQEMLGEVTPEIINHYSYLVE